VVIALAAEPLTIGRDSGQDGVSGALGQDPELSRRHASVWDAGGAPMIEDLGSSNGTFVNDRRIDGPTPLHPGDTVKIGDTTLTVERDSDPEATTIRSTDPGATRVRRSPPAQAPPAAGSPAPAEPPRAAKSGLLDRIAGLSDRHPGRVLGGIGVFFVIAVVLGAPVAGMMHANDPFNDHTSQSVVVNKLIGDATGERSVPQVIALVTPPGGVSAPGSRALVASVAAAIRQDPTVTRTVTYYSTASRSSVSRDGRSTYVAAFFKKVSDNDASEAAKRLLNRVQRSPAVLLGGPAIAGQQLGSEVGKDLGMAEGLAFPILFILSLFVFRGVVAALMPLFVGAITVMTTFLVLRVVNSFVSLSQFALNIVIGLGLGLAIDYSLFVVSRYREERAKIGHDESGSHTGAPPRSEARAAQLAGAEQEALHRAIHTAGRTIIYSAVTVALALATLCVIPTPFMFSMGLGGAITALVAVTVALIALPVLLAVLGPRINSLAPARWRRAAERTASQQQEGPWYRLSQAVMRRPVPIATVCVVVLLALGLPFTGIKFIGVDASGVPKGQSARTVDDTLLRDYPTDSSSQITALVKAPPSAGGQIAALAAQVRRLPGAVGAGGPATSLRGGYWTFTVSPAQRPLAAATISLVKNIRAHPNPRIEASGTTAQFLDQRATISSLLPLVAIILCVLTFIVLFLMTGSVILPLKSLLMTFLSLSAAFGVLVLIFQDGHLQGLLGFQSLHGIDISQPILIFAVAFGLSSDYTVFLLTRIKEARDAGHPNRDSVAIGLERTGRIVTQAAVLFCVAIGAFATSSIVFIKEVGIGIAVAVLIDATIIRALLVPSLMALLGERNWWAPAPLRRLHKRIGLSEGSPPR
jgi:RND superfamily putative drug exporter